MNFETKLLNMRNLHIRPTIRVSVVFFVSYLCSLYLFLQMFNYNLIYLQVSLRHQDWGFSDYTAPLDMISKFMHLMRGEFK